MVIKKLLKKLLILSYSIIKNHHFNKINKGLSQDSKYSAKRLVCFLSIKNHIGMIIMAKGINDNDYLIPIA